MTATRLNGIVGMKGQFRRFSRAPPHVCLQPGTGSDDGSPDNMAEKSRRTVLTRIVFSDTFLPAIQSVEELESHGDSVSRRLWNNSTRDPEQQ